MACRQLILRVETFESFNNQESTDSACQPLLLYTPGCMSRAQQACRHWLLVWRSMQAPRATALQAGDSTRKAGATATLRWSSALRSFWWPSQPPESSKRVLETKASKAITICSCQMEPGVSVSKSNEWASAGNSYSGNQTYHLEPGEVDSDEEWDFDQFPLQYINMQHTHPEETSSEQFSWPKSSQDRQTHAGCVPLKVPL